MNDQSKTKHDLIQELVSLRKRIEELSQYESERKLAEEALRESEYKYKSLINNVPDIIFTIDLEGKITFVSQRTKEILGYENAETINRNIFNFIPEADHQRALENLQKGMKGGKIKHFQIPMIAKSGERLFFECSFTRIYKDGAVVGAQGTAVDITERKQAEEELIRVNRALRMLSDTNQALIHITDEVTLLNEVCRIIVDVGGYRLAWVGLAEHDEAKTVRPVAHAGFESGYIESAKVTWADNERGRGPGGTAIRSGQPSIARNIPLDPDFAPWREAAIERGYKSNIALPLISEGQTLGELAIYSVEADAFNAKEVEILKELADDLAFGITALRTRVKRDQTAVALRESEERYRLIAENTADTIAVFDLNLNPTYISPSILKLRGYPVQEAMTQTLNQMLTPDSLQQASKMFADQMALESSGTADPARTALIELEEYCKDGSTIWVELAASFLRDHNFKPTGILTITRDITDRKLAEDKLALNYETQAAMNILLGLSLEGRPVKDFLYCALDLVLSLKWLAIESKGAIFLTDRVGKTLHLQAQRGLAKELCAMCKTVPYGHCLCGRAAAARAVQFADRVDEHHDTHYEGMPPHGHYCVPILSSDHVLGIIVLYVKEGHIRSPWEEDFLKAVANSLAVTIERRQAEEALKESENKYRLLADNVHDVIFVLDMNLKYTYISPSVKIMRGYEPEEVLKQPSVEQTLTPSSMDLAMKALSDVMELEKIKHGEITESRTLQLEMRRKDETTVWTEVTFSFIRDEDQRPVGILGLTRDITERKQAEEVLQQTLESLRKAIDATIQAMVSAVEMRDPYTAGHQKRVADLARVIATEMGLPQEKIDGIRLAGSIHDIGKLSVPAEILSKPTKLTNTEFSLIKEHPQSGYEMLKDVESPWPLAQIVYQHHERMDGSGYPRNLKGDEILMEARIMAVADVAESMASHRPYRPALGIEAALEEIEKNGGILYDDAVVDACLRLFREKGYKLT